jgi:hypothetical protein
VAGTILHQFSGLPAPRFSRGKWLELLFISSLVSLSQGSVEESGLTVLHQFSGLSVPRFSREKWLELFFISSLVCLSQGSQEGSGWNYSSCSLVSLSQGSLERTGWNCSSTVLLSLCPKVLKRELVGTILHQFSGLSVLRFSKEKRLELFFTSSLVCLSQGSVGGSGWNYFFQFYGMSVPRFSRGKW